MGEITHMSDLAQTIGRVRRAMPRNADVMAVCDAERLMAAAAIAKPPTLATVPECPACAVRRKLTQAEHQRNYRLRLKARKAAAVAAAAPT
jgi:hypothetical protein